MIKTALAPASLLAYRHDQPRTSYNYSNQELLRAIRTNNTHIKSMS